MHGQDWIERAGELFEAAMFVGDTSALDLSDDVLDAVEAPLSMARGKVLHGTRPVRRKRCSGSAAGTRWSRVTVPPAGRTSSGPMRGRNPSTTG